jgi:hypothetical protein
MFIFNIENSFNQTFMVLIKMKTWQDNSEVKTAILQCISNPI